MAINPVYSGSVLEPAYILSLPNETLENVFRFFDYKCDQDSLNLVCRQFYIVSLEACKRVELIAYKKFIALFNKSEVIEKRISILEQLIYNADNFTNLKFFLRELDLFVSENFNPNVEARTLFEKRKLTLMVTINSAKKILEKDRDSAFDNQLSSVYNALLGMGYNRLALELSSYFFDRKKRDAIPYTYIMSLIQQEKIEEALNKAMQIEGLTNKYRCLDLVKDAYQTTNDLKAVAKVNRLMNFLPVNFDKLLERTKFVNNSKALVYASNALNKKEKNSHLFDMACMSRSNDSKQARLLPAIIRSITSAKLKNRVCSQVSENLSLERQNDLAYEIAQMMNPHLTDTPFLNISISYAKVKEFVKAIHVASRIRGVDQSSQAFCEIADLLLEQEQYFLCVEVLLKIDDDTNLSKFIKLNRLFCILAHKRQIPMILKLFNQNNFPDEYKKKLITSVVVTLQDQRPREAYEFILSFPLDQLTVSTVAHAAYAFFQWDNFSKTEEILKLKPSQYKPCTKGMLEIALINKNLHKISEFIKSLQCTKDQDSFLKFISRYLFYKMDDPSRAEKIALTLSDKNKKARLLAELSKYKK